MDHYFCFRPRAIEARAIISVRIIRRVSKMKPDRDDRWIYRRDLILAF